MKTVFPPNDFILQKDDYFIVAPTQGEDSGKLMIICNMDFDKYRKVSLEDLKAIIEFYNKRPDAKRPHTFFFAGVVLPEEESWWMELRQILGWGTITHIDFKGELGWEKSANLNSKHLENLANIFVDNETIQKLIICNSQSEMSGKKLEKIIINSRSLEFLETNFHDHEHEFFLTKRILQNEHLQGVHFSEATSPLSPTNDDYRDKYTLIELSNVLDGMDLPLFSDLKEIYFKKRNITFLNETLFSEIDQNISPESQLPSIHKENLKFSKKLQAPWSQFPIIIEFFNCDNKNHYAVCLITGKIPLSIQEEIRRLDKQLEKHDFNIHADSENYRKDVYLIIESNKLVGLLVFMNENNNCRVLSRDLRVECQQYFENREKNKKKEIKDERKLYILDQKIHSNQGKKRYFESRKKPHSINNVKRIEKYKEKRKNYERLTFYFESCAKQVKLKSIPKIQMFLSLLNQEQSQKILSKLWPHFQKQYGIVNMDEPNSQMKEFLKIKKCPEPWLEMNGKRLIIL